MNLSFSAPWLRFGMLGHHESAKIYRSLYLCDFGVFDVPGLYVALAARTRLAARLVAVTYVGDVRFLFIPARNDSCYCSRRNGSHKCDSWMAYDCVWIHS